MGESSLVVGAGVIGSRVAGMLAERGDRVSVVSRHGSGPAGLPGVTQVAAGRVQDLSGDLRPGPLPGGARN